MKKSLQTVRKVPIASRPAVWRLPVAIYLLVQICSQWHWVEVWCVFYNSLKTWSNVLVAHWKLIVLLLLNYCSMYYWNHWCFLFFSDNSKNICLKSFEISILHCVVLNFLSYYMWLLSIKSRNINCTVNLQKLDFFMEGKCMFYVFIKIPFTDSLILFTFIVMVMMMMILLLKW